MGHRKWLHPLTRWVGGLKKGQKHAYVIFEWSLNGWGFSCSNSALVHTSSIEIGMLHKNKNTVQKLFQPIFLLCSTVTVATRYVHCLDRANRYSQWQPSFVNVSLTVTICRVLLSKVLYYSLCSIQKGKRCFEAKWNLGQD